MIITEQTFASVCFLALMQNGESLTDKVPSYIEEKQDMLFDGSEAFGLLDIFRQRVVLNWCKKWHVELPEVVKSYVEDPRYQQMYEDALRKRF